MKYAIIFIILFSLLVISLSTVAELVIHAPSGPVQTAFQSVYKDDASFGFLLDPSSSFYSIYTIHHQPPYLPYRKLGHFVIYGLLAGLIFILLPVKDVWQRALLAATSATLVGFIDEVHQHFLIGRSGRILDVIINAAGSITAVLTLAILCCLLSLGRKIFHRILHKVR